MTRFESPPIPVPRRGSSFEASDAGYPVVWVEGEHDIATRASLVVAIARAARRDDAAVVVDLRDVTFMDASTIRALLVSRNRMRTRSQSLRLRAPSPVARRVLELCGLTHLVQAGPAEAAHPGGAAAALSTWVDVAPSTPPGSEALPSEERRPIPSLASALPRQAATDATTEADRGGR